MNDRETRLSYCVALTPIAVVVFAALYGGLHLAGGSRAFYWAAGLTSLLIPAFGAVIWRRYLSVPRPWRGTFWLGVLATSVLCLVLHAVAGTPFIRFYSWWDGPDQAVFAGQCLMLGGVTWLIGSAVILPEERSSSSVFPGKGAAVMTPDARRLVIAIALVPLLSGVWWFWYWLDDRVAGASFSTTVLRAFAASGVVMVVVWLLVWRRRVRWTVGVVAGTGLLAILTLALPVACYFIYGLMIAAAQPGGRPLVWLATEVLPVVPLLGAVLWLCGTAWLWRRPADLLQHGDSVVHSDALTRCPACLYSLRGLREARCPECGWNATLDELVERGLARLAGGV